MFWIEIFGAAIGFLLFLYLLFRLAVAWVFPIEKPPRRRSR
jgi:hypothetical protein